VNRLPQIIAAAMLLACYAPPVRAEAPPRFADHPAMVFAGKRAKFDILGNHRRHIGLAVCDLLCTVSVIAYEFGADY
jgi:hypothetical protein